LIFLTWVIFKVPLYSYEVSHITLICCLKTNVMLTTQIISTCTTLQRYVVILFITILIIVITVSNTDTLAKKLPTTERFYNKLTITLGACHVNV